MGVKEASIVAVLLGGAGGAGAAYATDNFGLTSKSKVNRDQQLDPFDCNQDVSSSWGSDIPSDTGGGAEVKSEDWNSSLNAQKGCLSINLFNKNNKKADKLTFKLAAWNQNEDKKKESNGVVVWSILSKGNNDKAVLTSRVFYLSKVYHGAWKTKRGLAFSSELDKDSTITLNGTSTTIDKILKIGNDDADIDNSVNSFKNKRFNWTYVNGKGAHLLTDYVKIAGKTHSDKFALFFGKDLPANSELQAKVKGIYFENNVWKTAKDNPAPTFSKPIFQSDHKGTWTPES